jgi:hypothetical protein
MPSVDICCGCSAQRAGLAVIADHEHNLGIQGLGCAGVDQSL